MKLSVDEAKLTGLWARNCATIQQALISKFVFRARKVIGTFETRAPGARFWKVPVTFRDRNQIFRRNIKNKSPGPG